MHVRDTVKVAMVRSLALGCTDVLQDHSRKVKQAVFSGQRIDELMAHWRTKSRKKVAEVISICLFDDLRDVDFFFFVE